MVSRLPLLSGLTGVKFLPIRQTIHSVCSQSVVLPSKYSLPTLLVQVSCSRLEKDVVEPNQDGLPISKLKLAVKVIHLVQEALLEKAYYSTSTMQKTGEHMHTMVLVPSMPSLVLLNRLVLTIPTPQRYYPLQALLGSASRLTGMAVVLPLSRVHWLKGRPIITKDLELYSTLRLLTRQLHIITVVHPMISLNIVTTDLLPILQLNLLRFNLLLMKPLRVVRTTELLI